MTPCETVTPCVSVVIPTRNRPELLRQAIASVRAQTFSDYEIIVVVNGPDEPVTRASVEAAQGCRVERIFESGIGVALNAGIKAARGEWVALLDDDDLWEPSWLAVALETAQRQKADVVFGDVISFYERGGVPTPPLRPPAQMPEREAFMFNVYSGCSAAFLRRSAVEAVGGFDPAFKSPDYDLWMRLAWRFHVAWANQHLVWVRIHEQNTSKALSWMRSMLQIQWKAFRTLPPDLHRLRPRLAWTMLNVVTKGTTSHLRRFRARFRAAKPPLTGTLRPPVGR